VSNWSVVILAWSSLESGEYGDDREWHVKRLDEITKSWHRRGLSPGLGGAEEWRTVPSCGQEGAPGSACQFVAVTHENHFNVDDLVAAVYEHSWEYPECVALMWRDEQMDGFSDAFGERAD